MVRNDTMRTWRKCHFPLRRGEWVRGEEMLEGLQILTKGLSFQNGKEKGKMGVGLVFIFPMDKRARPHFLIMKTESF